MKLFGSTRMLIDRTKTGQNMPGLEIVELVLVHCNLVDNEYQQKFEVLHTFRPNKTYLLNVSIKC